MISLIYTTSKQETMYIIYNNDDKWYTKFDNGDIYNYTKYGVVEEHKNKPFSLL